MVDGVLMQTKKQNSDTSGEYRKLVEELRSLRSKLARMEREREEMEHASDMFCRAEPHFRTIFDNVTDMISYVSPVGKILDVNKRVEDLLGYSRDEVIGKHFVRLGIIGLKQLPQTIRMFREMLKSGQIRDSFEMELYHKNGSRVHVEIGTRFVKENGRTLGIVSIFRDITKRKNLEQALRRSEIEHMKAQEIAGIGSFSVDVATGEQTWSDQIYRILGVTPGEAPPTYEYFMQCVHAEDREHLDRHSQETFAGRKNLDVRYRIVRPEGQIRHVHTQAQLDRQDNGTCSRIYGFTQDITERTQAEEALGFFRFAIDRCSDAAYWMGPDARFVYVNKAACKSLGYTHKELLSKSVHDVDPDFPAQAWPEHWKELRQQGSMTFESRHRTKDGHIIPVEISANFIVFGGKEYNCAFARNISDRKKAEEALRQSSSKLNAMLESIGDQIGMVDRDLNIIWANDRTKEIFGQDIIGRKCYEAYHGRTGPCGPGRCVAARAFEDGRIHSRETQVVDKKGRTRYNHCTANVALRDEQGNPTAVIEVSRDITERKRAEQKIKQYNEFLNNVIESLSHPFYVIDANDYTVKTANSAAWDGKAGRNVKCYRLVHDRSTPCDEAEHSCPLAEVKRTRKQTTVEHAHYDDDAKPRHVEVHAYPIFDSQGQVSQVIEYCLDITQRKLAQDQARERQAELNRLWRINTAGEMASGLAHELNQPLCAITNYSNGCLRVLNGTDGKNQKVVDALEQISLQADRASSIISHMRSMVAKNPPARSDVNITATIREVLDMVDSEANKNGIDISTKLTEQIQTVHANKIEIQQVILNLVRNSFEAMNETETDHRRLLIRTKNSEEGAIEISVHDNGIGLTEETARRAFDPFFTTKKDGLGVGLSLSRSIIEAHGGKLWAQPNRDGGAVFSFTLPMKG
jgi:PAS domain S-box-containing protein